MKLSGYFDHENEYKVETFYRGEKGVQIITPFYTHMVDGKPQAIFVNRGWVPYDLKASRLHYCALNQTIEGVLYTGMAETKYSEPNNPVINEFKNCRLNDFTLVSQINNREEASKFMLK